MQTTQEWSQNVIRCRSLEVLLGVIPRLYEAVSQAEGCSLVCLLVIKGVATPGKRVLHMVDNGLFHAQHI